MLAESDLVPDCCEGCRVTRVDSEMLAITLASQMLVVQTRAREIGVLADQTELPSSYRVDRESKVSEHLDRAGLPTLEVT